MVNLSDIYANAKNPLENLELLKKIVDSYIVSNRTNFLGPSNLYTKLVRLSGVQDNSNVNMNDMETFYVETYNEWIENILSLDEKQAKAIEEKSGMDVRKLQQYFKSFGKLSSYDDVLKLKSNPLVLKDINNWELIDNGWVYIKSKYISGRREKSIPVEHRLYIGCQNQDLWKVAKLFKEKCTEQKIPFYFKFSSSIDRDDKIVIYSDTDNLAQYIEILRKIGIENPDILKRCGTPPLLTENIDGWIGISDEPPVDSKGKSQSYNELRTYIIEDSIEEIALTYLNDFAKKDIDVVYQGKKVRRNDLLLDQATQKLIEIIIQDKKIENVTKEELEKDNVKAYLKKQLGDNLQIGINKLFEVKDIKKELGGSNSNTIFTLSTLDGKKIEIDTNDMDEILKSMVSIIKEIRPNFYEDVFSKIVEKCRKNGIDDNFFFQKSTKAKFASQDAKVTRSSSALSDSVRNELVQAVQVLCLLERTSDSDRARKIAEMQLNNIRRNFKNIPNIDEEIAKIKQEILNGVTPVEEAYTTGTKDADKTISSEEEKEPEKQEKEEPKEQEAQDKNKKYNLSSKFVYSDITGEIYDLRNLSIYEKATLITRATGEMVSLDDEVISARRSYYADKYIASLSERRVLKLQKMYGADWEKAIREAYEEGFKQGTLTKVTKATFKGNKLRKKDAERIAKKGTFPTSKAKIGLEELKFCCEEFDIHKKDNGFEVVDKDGKVITNPRTRNMVMFAKQWAAIGKEIAFSETGEQLYSLIQNQAQKDLEQKGIIDVDNLQSYAADLGDKGDAFSKITTFLFQNDTKTKFMDSYFRMQTPKAIPYPPVSKDSEDEKTSSK